MAVDYPTIFRAWIPKDFKRCVKVNDLVDTVADIDALEETLRWQGEKCFEWTFDYATFCVAGDKVCGDEPNFYYEVVNPFGCVDCKPGNCASDKEWYTIVQVNPGEEVYPDDEFYLIGADFEEIEIFEPNMLFPLMDENGTPVFRNNLPIELFWDEIDDRVILCLDAQFCMEMYEEWKVCISDTTIDAANCLSTGWEFTTYVKKVEFFESWGEYCLFNDANVETEIAPGVDPDVPEGYINEFGDVCIFYDDIFNIDPQLAAWIEHSSQLTVQGKFTSGDLIAEAANVELMDSFFTEADFNELFPYALQDQLYSYSELRMAVAAMPAFLNKSVFSDEELNFNRSQNQAKRELAAFLAHTIGNTNKFERPEPTTEGTITEPEYDSVHQGLYRMFWKDCPQNADEVAAAISDNDLSCKGSPEGDYVPAGYDATEWYPNFGPMMTGEASTYFMLQQAFMPKEWVGDIMTNPMSAQAPDFVWLSGIGAWMQGADRAPSGHAIVSGYWKREMAEKDANIGRGFGATLAAYHPADCGKNNGRLRIMETSYKYLLNQFGWEAPEGFTEKTNCEETILEDYPENIFTFGSFWAPIGDTCMRQDEPTDYNIYRGDAYYQCIKDNFATTQGVD